MWLFPKHGAFIFLANLWLLSYPHTVATYQRSYFRLINNKVKAFVIFIFFVILNYLLYQKYDLTMLMNIYFYSQFFHYFRQNFGLAKIYTNNWSGVDSIFFHLLNICALLVLWNNTSAFLGYKLFGIILMDNQSYIYLVSIIIYGLYVLYRNLHGIRYSPMLYIHLALLTLTVLWTHSFLIGWLGLHFFHNIQYLIMNWQLNKRISFLHSYLKSVLIVFILYSAVQYFDAQMYLLAPLSFIVILSVNYSHYFFDSYLWKRKYREAFP